MGRRGVTPSWERTVQVQLAVSVESRARIDAVAEALGVRPGQALDLLIRRTARWRDVLAECEDVAHVDESARRAFSGSRT